MEMDKTISAKPKSKFNIVSLPILAIIISIIVLILSGVASWVLFKQKSDLFQDVEKYPSVSEAEVKNAIQEGVVIDNKVTITYVRKNTTAYQFRSNEKLYTVFRVNAPETCGKGGCLYIVTAKDTLPILLQLVQLKPGESMFLPLKKSKCFSVVQNDNFNNQKSYEVCEK
jgi:hypothetical protein